MLLISSQLLANTPIGGRAEDPILYNIVRLEEGMPDTICYNTAPGMIMGTNPGPGIYTYQWQSSTTSATAGFSNIVSATLRDYVPGNLVTTTWYRRIVTSSTETHTSDAIQITVTPNIIHLVVNNPDAVCSPQVVDLTDPAIIAGSSPGLAYGFFTDAAATSPVVNPAAISSSVALNADYYIRATNKCGNEEIAPVRVVINIPPAISASGPAAAVCKGAEVSLTATAAGSTVVWQGIGNGHSIIVKPNTTTGYTAVATGANGCSASAVVTVDVIDFAMELTANPAAVISGNNVTLTSSANRLYAVNAWFPENVFPNQIAVTQDIAVTESARTFSVVGISEDGCRDTASVMITVGANEGDVFIPNAFTPNNDGKNDVFKVYGSSIKDIEMKIYNQWGNFVFETKDNVTGWNGTQNGRHQPVGVYMYIIKIRLNNEDSFIKRGSVTLIR